MKKLFLLFTIIYSIVLFSACTGKPEEASTVVEQYDDTMTAVAEGVMSYDEYEAVDEGAAVIVETAVSKIISRENDEAVIQTQEEKGRYVIYVGFCSNELYEQLNPGTGIRVTGYKETVSGESRIIDAEIELLQ